MTVTGSIRLKIVGQKTLNDDNLFVFVVAQGAGIKKDRCHLCKESGVSEKQEYILWPKILMYERIMNIKASHYFKGASALCV